MNPPQITTSISINDWTQYITQQLFVVIGIGLAAIFVFNTWKSTQFSNQINTDQMLINCRKECRDLMIKMKDDNSFGEFYNQAVEDMLNAYELSCGLYLSGGVDKDRFRKLRKKEIISLFSHGKPGKKTYAILHDADNPYEAMKDVYGEFTKK
jgi:hypothetical protein